MDQVEERVDDPLAADGLIGGARAPVAGDVVWDALT